MGISDFTGPSNFTYPYFLLITLSNFVPIPAPAANPAAPPTPAPTPAPNKAPITPPIPPRTAPKANLSPRAFSLAAF
jgi:hypothetical protein